MKKQTGSSHVIIVIVLVLALVTALGWIFWQNFVHKEPAIKETEILKIQNGSNQTEACGTDTGDYVAMKINGRYALIEDWSIKFTIPEELKDQTIVISHREPTKGMNDLDVYHISTREAQAEFAAASKKDPMTWCNNGATVQTLLLEVTRYTDMPSGTTNTHGKQLKNYYYETQMSGSSIPNGAKKTKIAYSSLNTMSQTLQAD
jgi:hypothetical protein